MDWKSLNNKEKRAWAIIVTFGVVIGYLSLAWAGAIPNDYNIVENYYGEGVDTETDNTTVVSGRSLSQVAITGIPDIVNISESPTNTYTIQVMAIDGAIDDVVIRLRTDDTVTNATFELTGDIDWSISPEGNFARYVGGGVIPFETTTLTLSIDGDEFTLAGSVMVMCTSSGETSANAGTILVIV